ncbi:hypothetical protein ELE18_05765 [Klebsiella quasipneumoniae]|nr:hypothetical protein ELE18_05765 [Klebsiella quasipneumoniae]OYF86935.1 hypothetical protein CI612_03890 [Klebsiella quasipneumoniae subsp. similipneumoniae]
MILPVAKVAGSVLHVSPFYSTPLLTATISDQNHKTEIIFFYFLCNQMKLTMILWNRFPIKHGIARRCGAVTDQYPIDKQDKIRCRKIMQPWRNR